LAATMYAQIAHIPITVNKFLMAIILAVMLFCSMGLMSDASADTLQIAAMEAAQSKPAWVKADAIALNGQTPASVDKRWHSDFHVSHRISAEAEGRPARFGNSQTTLNSVDPSQMKGFEFESEYEDPGWTRQTEFSF
jgi:hypothetical protein